MRLLKTDHLPGELRELLLEKAEGVPLFVEELTKSLTEQGVLQHDDGSWRLTVSSRDLRIPDTVQGIILARLDRLEEELKRILQVGAVLGPVVIYRVLANTVDVNGQLATRLRDLQRLGFLRQTRRQPEIEYVFRHGLIRDVAYQTMLQRNRRELHLRVGAAMEVTLGDRLSEYQGIIAEHFLRAEAWEKAARYLLRAGDDSMRLHAHAEARLHYGNAMDALSRLPDIIDNRRRRLETIVKQAAVSYIAEPPELNLERLSRGEALARALLANGSPTDDDRLRLAWIHYWKGRINYIRGDPPQAIEYYERALAVAKELRDARLITIASAMIGQAFTTQGQWVKAKQLLSQALPILERSGEWREWCLASGYLGVSLAACAEYERGLAMARSGVDRAIELRGWNLIASTRILLCAAYVMNERMEALAEAAQEAIDASERSGEQVVLYVGLGFRGWAEARLDNHAAALASMERSREVGAGLGQLLLADWFAVARADIALCAGQIEEALILAVEAVQVAKRASSVFSAGLAHRVWARALAASTPPRPEEADAHLATSLELLES
jgi:predicted ATPase